MIDFFDSSALAKHYVRDRGSQAVRQVTRTRPIAVARVTHAELASTFARMCREGRFDEATREALLDRVDQDFAVFNVVEWRLAVARTVRGLVCRHALRALDAVQLASALALGARRARFWCSDARLVTAAGAEGLRVMRPS